MALSQTTSVILAGGLGTRLRSVVRDVPKPMVEVLGQPFLAYLLQQIHDAGGRDVVLCVGHLCEVIQDHFGDGAALGMRIRYAVEQELLGTGGAVVQALPMVESDRFLLLNGDSFCPVDIHALLHRHDAAGATATLTAAWVDDASRFGTLDVDDAGQIHAFHEKRDQPGGAYVNAGVYVIDRPWLSRFTPGENRSLERDLLPPLAPAGKLAAMRVDVPFLDIGTPESLAEAADVLPRLQQLGPPRPLETRPMPPDLSKFHDVTPEAIGEHITRSLHEGAAVRQRVLDDPAFGPLLVDAANLVLGCLRSGRKVILFGNGGSAADSQHLAAEFVSRFTRDRQPLPALALTTDTSALTAIGNDYGFDQLFARQLGGLAQPGDVVIAISTSGRSPNVLVAVDVAREIGLPTIGLTGGTGGDLREQVDLPIVVPSDVTAYIQEMHIAIGHALCGCVDLALE